MLAKGAQAFFLLWEVQYTEKCYVPGMDVGGNKE